MDFGKLSVASNILQQHLEKGTVKASDIQIIWESSPIIQGPVFVRKDLSEAFNFRVRCFIGTPYLSMTMKLILVTSFDTIQYEHYLINLLFCEGLEYLHLRKKAYTEQEMEEYIRKIPPPFRNRAVLHSHFHLIQRFGLKGAHFTKDNCSEELFPHSSISKNEKPYAHLSFSLHTIAEIKCLPKVYDYIFLSPVFDSISNRGFNSRFQPGDLKTYLHQDLERPEIIALSGIMPENIDKAIDLGFDGVAMLGHIWTPFERDQNLVQAVQRFKRVQKLINFFQDNPMLAQNKK